MKNKHKLGVGLVFVLVLVGMGVYFVLLPSETPALAVTNQNNSVTGNNQVKVTNDGNNKANTQKIDNKTSKQTSNPNERVYNGKTYKVFGDGELNAVGEGLVICPYCGGKASQIGDAETVGDYWYYYYHCGSCGVNIAEKGLNH